MAIGDTISTVNDDYSVLSSPTESAERTRLSIDFTTTLSPAQAEAVLQDPVPDLLPSAELQGAIGNRYILSLPATISIQQISKLVRDLSELPAISRVDMQVTDWHVLLGFRN